MIPKLNKPTKLLDPKININWGEKDIIDTKKKSNDQKFQPEFFYASGDASVYGVTDKDKSKLLAGGGSAGPALSKKDFTAEELEELDIKRDARAHVRELHMANTKGVFDANIDREAAGTMERNELNSARRQRSAGYAGKMKQQEYQKTNQDAIQEGRYSRGSQRIVKQMVDKSVANVVNEHKAATNLQKVYRGSKGREEALDRQVVKSNVDGAIKRAVKSADKEIAEKETRGKAATNIQKVVRGNKVRKEVTNDPKIQAKLILKHGLIPQAVLKNKREAAEVKTAIETSLDGIYKQAASAAKQHKAANAIQTAARSKLQRLAEQRSNAPPSTAFEGRGEQDLGGAFNEGIDRARQIAKQSGDAEALDR